MGYFWQVHPDLVPSRSSGDESRAVSSSLLVYLFAFIFFLMFSVNHRSNLFPQLLCKNIFRQLEERRKHLKDSCAMPVTTVPAAEPRITLDLAGEPYLNM